MVAPTFENIVSLCVWHREVTAKDIILQHVPILLYDISANVPEKIAEAIVEIGISQLMMNNLNNALNTFEKALNMQKENNNVEGICETKMHMSAVLQK